ncbi:MAG: hypothetical protein AAGA80_22665 [Cyanobacteria bacterium P01_F01_bin.143]
MEDIPASSSIEQEYKANVDLSYEYIAKSIKEIQDKSNNINTELGLLIGFNLTFIRFFISELPDKVYDLDFLPYNYCLKLKIFAYVFSIASIACCFWGLYTRAKYLILPPNLLIEKCDEVPSLEFKLAIMKTWQDKFNSFITLTKRKKDLFNYSLFLFLFSALIAALDSI